MGYSASSSASSNARSNSAFDNSGFSVNFGNQQQVPSWLWIAGAALLALYIVKGHK